MLTTSIESRRQDPSAYLCVVFEIRDQVGRVLHREKTRAASRSRWSVAWSENDRVRLDSLDIGAYYWQRRPGGK